MAFSLDTRTRADPKQQLCRTGQLCERQFRSSLPHWKRHGNINRTGARNARGRLEWNSAGVVETRN
eukprot:8656360-Pyramimonas_sp.AAC.1